VHIPQLSGVPHPSLVLPQSLFCAEQLMGVQHMLLWHTSLPAQVPQLIIPPQPSLTMPHALAGHARGVHAMHVPPMQIWPCIHPPQFTLPDPQALGVFPQ
jgi:hypothetical protein